MRRWTRQFAFVLVLALAWPNVAVADWQQSTSYGMNESEVGGSGCTNVYGTGLLCGTSSNYSLGSNIDDGGSTLGEFAVGGGSSSTNYSAGSGFNTTAQPGLAMVVNTSSIDLGDLSTSVKSTTTATFDVSNYTTYGYVVQVIGSPPTYAGNPINALTSDTASSPGTEQFGLNTVLNSVAGVGADPVQIPSTSFSYGVAGDGATGTYGTSRPYTQSDKWRFVSGETIASAPKSSGVTRYTVTFMANISNLTPGGKHTGSMEFVATGTY